MIETTTECPSGCSIHGEPHVHIKFVPTSDHEMLVPREIIQLKQPLTLKERFRMARDNIDKEQRKANKRAKARQKLDESAKELGYVRYDEIMDRLPGLIHGVLNEREAHQKEEAEKKAAKDLWEAQQAFLDSWTGIPLDDRKLGTRLEVDPHAHIYDSYSSFGMRHTCQEGEVSGAFVWSYDTTYGRQAWLRLADTF